ncbi:hypothetical protein XAB3213_1070012 [Xanthomonas citri pv. bilvae]|nr:hypothetical protein XAB3213_1070012 [Xanthomonas citri pv. bilvae]
MPLASDFQTLRQGGKQTGLNATRQRRACAPLCMPMGHTSITTCLLSEPNHDGDGHHTSSGVARPRGCATVRRCIRLEHSACRLA